MRSRRTWFSNCVFRLPGGTEDNDLFVNQGHDGDGVPIIRSVWVPTEEERLALAAGAAVELVLWGTVQPPVAMNVDFFPIGAAPRDVEVPDR